MERLSGISAPGADYTVRYEQYVVEQVRQSGIRAVAEKECPSWDAVQGVLKRFAEHKQLFEKPEVVCWLAFDEIALKKGHFWAAAESLPQALIIIDRFHVERNLRRQLPEPERGFS